MELDEYATKYPDIKFERHDGILEFTVHTDGGSLLWSERAHRHLGDAFADVANDAENHVVILTGTGDDFLTTYNWGPKPDTPAKWDVIFREGVRLLLNFIDIPVPVIAAINGPARVHAEVPLLADIVLASETAVLQDAPHLLADMVPGDGVHIVWQELLGLNRGRYFLMTGQELTPQEALDLGVVNEVLPRNELLERARAHAADLMKRPPLTLRYTRACMTMAIRDSLNRYLAPGLLYEGLAAVEMRSARS